MGSSKIPNYRPSRPIPWSLSRPSLIQCLALAVLSLSITHPRSIAAYAIPMLPFAVGSGVRRIVRDRIQRARMLFRYRNRRADAAIFGRLARLCRAEHSAERQARLACLVAFLSRAAGCTDATARLLAKASTVHRIGYVSLPDERHDVQAALRASRIAGLLLQGEGRLLSEATDMARSHKERWDGNGLPRGVAGDRIPYAARLLHTALVLESLILDQRLSGQILSRSAMSVALARLECFAGGALDPSIARLAGHHADTLWALLLREPFAVPVAVPVQSRRHGSTGTGSGALA